MKKIILLIVISTFTAFYVNAQEISVSGTITGSNGEALPGVNIIEKGTYNGTVSDIDGSYSLTVSAEDATLVFTSIGYVTEEIPLAGRSIIDVTLTEDVLALEEVVVVGYGTQKKASVVGAISSVDIDKLATTATSNLSNAISGRVSGIIGKMGEGKPGADDAKIFIRGRATTNSSEPLVLIDGMEGSLSRINPNDIASFSVLKDASATAVYGVRGANGVILITTKRGETGKAKVSVNSQVRLHEIIRYPKFLGSYDYARLYNEALMNDGMNKLYTDEDLALFKNGNDPYGHPNIDWFDVLIDDSYIEHRHNVSVRGGTEKVKYFVSGEYLNQEGAYKQFDDMEYSSNSSYRRLNFRTNFDFEVSRSTAIKVNLSYRNENINDVNSGDINGAGHIGLWDEVMRLRPVANTPLNPDGSYGDPTGTASNQHPYAVLRHGGFQNHRRNNLKGQIRLNQNLDKIMPGLSYTLMGGINTTNGYSLKLGEMPAQWHYDPDTETYTQISRERTPAYSLKDDKYKQLGHIETSFKYSRLFNNKHRLGGLLLYYRDRRINQANAPTNHLGLAGRITYAFEDKYLAEFNAGYNGSDQFNEDHRYAFLPAFSLGWVISKEDFFQSLGSINYLKIRGSYGTAGNDKIGNYKYLYTSNYNSVNAHPLKGGYWFGLNPVGVTALKEGSIANDRVSWEIAKKQNYGFDMELFNGQVALTGDYFFEKRSNILAKRATVTHTFGFVTGLPAENIGIVQNQGFELELTLRKEFGDFGIQFNGNYSYAKNKIIFMDEIPPTQPYKGRAGRPIGQHMGYLWSGAFYTYEELGYTWDESVDAANKYVLTGDPTVPVPAAAVQPGDLKFVDRNKDGVINAEDEGAIGKTDMPTSVYGLNLSLNYKNFRLSLFWQGAAGFSVDTKPYSLEFYNNGNAMETHLGRWAYFPEEGIDTRETATYPRLGINGATETSRESSFHLKSGNYLRLKNVELTYSLPQSLADHLRMDYVDIFITANNLLTFDQVKIIDPETSTGQDKFDNGIYPQSRFVGVGVNVGF